MDHALIPTLGDELFAALRQRRTVAPLSTRHPSLSIDQAYGISLHLLKKREAEGERVIGKKIGVTSKPVQDMLDVRQPDFGFLTDRMQIDDGSAIGFARHGMIQPRAEGEIAFMLKADLQGPGVTREQIIENCGWTPSFAGDVAETRAPDTQELEVLRDIQARTKAAHGG